MEGKHTFDSLKPCDLSVCTKREILDYFENTYDLYESLFGGITDEAGLYSCPDKLRLPLIFYFGHTSTVYVNKLYLAGFLKERVDFHLESLFETGVDEMSWDDVENYRMGGSYVWPSLSQVLEYRRKVKEVILKAIDRHPLSTPVTQSCIWWPLFLGMEHERIHFETSSVLIRQLPISMVTRPPKWKYGPVEPETPAPTNSLIRVEDSNVTIGKPKDFPSYGWDNEYGQWNVQVPSFEASKFLVTNGEFLEFVKSGGYKEKKFWSKEGWQWKEYRQAQHPTFWVCNQACKSGCGGSLKGYSHCNLSSDENCNEAGYQLNGTNGHVNGTNGHVIELTNGHSSCPYMYRAIFDVIEMPLTWPAEVNYHEAKAYCAWKGPHFRLPTEAEHHAMRGPQKSVSLGTSCDIIYQKSIPANTNMAYGSSTPVNFYPANEAGFSDVFGNVWEWIEDTFNGLPGFETHWLYDDFSSPCFDGQHNMIMGGSWVSTGDSASRFARYSFRPHFFQHLGFRLARSVTAPPPVRLVKTPVYVVGLGAQEREVDVPGVDDACSISSCNKQFYDDAEDVLDKELLRHYGDLVEINGNNNLSNPKTFAQICIEAMKEYNCSTNRAIDIMCSVGRLSFELANIFEEVVGVEHSGRLINAAMQLKKDASVVVQNGRSLTYQLPSDVSRDRVTFKQLTWLPNEIGTFDMITFANVQRVSNPKAWLVRLREITKPNGLVLIGCGGEEELELLKSTLGMKFDLLKCQPAVCGPGDASVTVWTPKMTIF